MRWNAGSLCARASASCARSCPPSLRRASMFCRATHVACHRGVGRRLALAGSAHRYLTGEIEALACQDQACSRLMTVLGASGRSFRAPWWPRSALETYSPGRLRLRRLARTGAQADLATGDRMILGKISRRGNRYLRVLFVQAAWVVLVRIKNWEHYGLKSWIEAAKEAAAPQRAGKDRARQQACPHRVGGAGQRTRLRADEDRRCRYIRPA